MFGKLMVAIVTFCLTVANGSLSFVLLSAVIICEYVLAVVNPGISLPPSFVLPCREVASLNPAMVMMERCKLYFGFYHK